MSDRVYLEPLAVSKTHVTKRWAVKSTGGSFLGEIKWYAQWRRYVFWPNVRTLFDAECLVEIAGICGEETEKRKRERKT